MESPRQVHMLEEDPGSQFGASGRVRDLMILRRKKPRPFSAANADGRLLPGRSAKSKSIPYGIEELYDRTLQLKSEANMLKADNTKLRTKLKQLEGKHMKRQSDDQPFLLDSLRKQIADLKLQLAAKDEDFLLLKKKLKFTKIAEIETELKVAHDESIRLNRMLMEAMEELTKGVMPIDLQERYLKLKVEYKGLKREFFELTAYVKDTKPRNTGQRFDPPRSKKSAATIELKTENAVLLQEIQKLKERLSTEVRCPKCGAAVESALQTEVEQPQPPAESVILRVWEALLDAGMKIPEFWQKLDPEMLGAVKSHTLMEMLASLGIQLSQEEVAWLFETLGCLQGEAVHKSIVEDTLEQYRPPLTAEQQRFIDHFSLKLQELRKDVADISTLLKLTEPHCTYEYFEDRLGRSLLRFKPQVSKGIADVCFIGYVHIPTERLYERIAQYLGTIELLMPEKEAELDAELRSLYAGRGSELIGQLGPVDYSGEGHVTFAQFIEVSQRMGIILPDHLHRYLKVLFYADQQELDQVPFETFAQAYCAVVPQ